MMPMRMGRLALFAVLFAVDFARAIFGFTSTAGLICPSLPQRRVTRLLGHGMPCPYDLGVRRPSTPIHLQRVHLASCHPEPAAASSERPKGAGPFFTRDLRGPAVR